MVFPKRLNFLDMTIKIQFYKTQLLPAPPPPVRSHLLCVCVCVCVCVCLYERERGWGGGIAIQVDWFLQQSCRYSTPVAEFVL